MKHFVFVLSMFLLLNCSYGQQHVKDSGTYLLHKFAQQVGTEKYYVEDSAGLTRYRMQFGYVDRGQPVTLAASLILTKGLQPVSYFIKGGTSRFSQINDSIAVKKNKATIKIDAAVAVKTIPPVFFTVAGYSPATTQMLLIQYWKQHGKPAGIAMLPGGTIRVKIDGEDSVALSGKAIMLDRYVITGLIWGNEIAWTDKSGQLLCLITNDAEGDKQEMVYEPYESLLPVFIEKAAQYGMKLFTKSAKPGTRQYDLIAIRNVNMADVVNGKVLPHTTVLVEKGIIKKAGVNVSIPPGAYIIDGSGKTLLPGMFDMHAHFQQAEWGPAYLAAGVTTVRDCGNEFEYINAVKDAIDNGSGVGPNILKAGIIDGKGPMALGIIQADTREEAIAAVDRYKQHGFVQIKIYSSAKPAIVKAICEEAHRVGLTVTGHIPEGMNLLQAVDSGLNMVNHIPYVFTVLKRNKDRTINFDDSTNKAVISFIRSHQTVVDATLGVFELAFRDLGEDIHIIEPNFSLLPEPLQVIFKNTGLPSADYESYGKPVFAAFKKTFKQLYDAGIPMVAGTDMGFPGYSLHRELEIYVDCGLTPMQALQLATIVPARVMKIDDAYGSIALNKKADLVLVDGDPFINIRAIRKTVTIIKDGRLYDPKQLRKMAGFNTRLR